MIAALIEAGLRALLIGVAVALGMGLLRMRNVVAQKAAWSLVLGAAILMPFIMRWQIVPASIALHLPLNTWQHTQASTPGVATVLQEGSESPDSPVSVGIPANGDRFPAPSFSHKAFDSVAREERGPSQPAPLASSPSSGPKVFRVAVAGVRNVSLGTVMEGVYAAVLLVLLIRLIVGLVISLGLWLESVPVRLDPGLNSAGFRSLPIRATAAIASPITVGSGVLLPMDYADWDVEKLRIVLAHERSHVRQGDFYLQTLASLYAAVFWFSPMGWWLKQKLCDLGEAIGDRAGLDEAASRTSYAQVLLEFAAMPRPTALGVAMARTSRLSHRIERFLNENTFRQSFGGSGRRILAAILLVPVALFAATELIRVEGAQSAPTVAPTEQAPVPAPVAPTAPALAPAAPAPDAAPVLAPPSPQPAPAPQAYGEIRDDADDRKAEIVSDKEERKAEAEDHEAADSMKASRRGTSHGRGYSYSYSSDGESYALVTGPGQHITFSGDWNEATHATVDKARSLAHGKFLWFTRGGKSYFIDDASLIAQLEAMQKPMDELGRQQEILGAKQEALGRQQEALGRKQERASIPTPHTSKEMAKLNEAMAKLNAKKGSTVTQEELADLEGKLGELQGRLGELQGEVGAKQGEFGEMQGKLGEQQGKLGEEQGRLGEQQGKLGRELERKVKSMIDQSLRDGKAKPID